MKTFEAEAQENFFDEVPNSTKSVQMSNPNPIPRPPEPTANGEYNADGYDPDGYDRDGYNAMGFDVTGYDRTGFDASGQDINGYTLEQQQAYEAYYLVNSEYHPDQPILEADKNWGTVTETNNYLTSSNTVSQGPLSRDIIYQAT